MRDVISETPGGRRDNPELVTGAVLPNTAFAMMCLIAVNRVAGSINNVVIFVVPLILPFPIPRRLKLPASSLSLIWTGSKW